MTIPSPDTIPAAEQTVAEMDPPSQEAKTLGACSVCHTEIAWGEPCETCSACGLPYHADCWTCNLGCAAYGCRNVNVLRTQPNISISSTPTPTREVMASDFAAIPSAKEEIPWEVAFVAGSVLAGLISMMTFGIPSLLLGAGAVYYGLNRPKAQFGLLLAACAISGVAVLGGVPVSFLLFVVDR